VERLLREFGIGASVGRPTVAYKETISETIQCEGKFSRQSATGKIQFGHVILRLSPLKDGIHFKFENRISGEIIPREYIPAVEKGIREAMTSGVIGGYPMTGVKAELIGGTYNELESNELAFKVAANMAYQDGTRKAGPILLEPIMDVEVVVPETYMGAVVGDINSRRGKINGMVHRDRDEMTVIAISAPLSEMFGYANTLRNISQGRAVFTMQFSRYAPVPQEITKKMFENIII